MSEKQLNHLYRSAKNFKLSSPPLEKSDVKYSIHIQMCHITYCIVQKLALQCGNWKQQQKVFLFMSAYQNT